MKTCPNCAAPREDNAAFCPFCGTKLETNAPAAQSSPEPEADDTSFSVPQPQTAAEEAQKKARSRKPLLITLTSLLLVGALVLVTVLTNCFGLISPLAPLGKAFLKTLTAKSLTMTQEIKIKQGGEVVNEEEHTLRIATNPRTEEFTELIKSETSTTLYYEDTLYYFYQNEDRIHAYTSDATEFVENYFNAINALTGKDPSFFEDQLLNSGAEEFFDLDELESFGKDFYKEFLNNKVWLKETLGFQKRGNTYSFDVDLGAVTESFFDFLLDSEYLTEKGENMVKDGLNLYETTLSPQLEGVELKLSFTLSFTGYLTEMKINTEKDDEEQAITIKFSDIGKTEIREKEIDKIVSKVEKYENDR